MKVQSILEEQMRLQRRISRRTLTGEVEARFLDEAGVRDLLASHGILPQHVGPFITANDNNGNVCAYVSLVSVGSDWYVMIGPWTNRKNSTVVKTQLTRDILNTFRGNKIIYRADDQALEDITDHTGALSFNANTFKSIEHHGLVKQLLKLDPKLPLTHPTNGFVIRMNPRGRLSLST